MTISDTALAVLSAAAKKMRERPTATTTTPRSPRSTTNTTATPEKYTALAPAADLRECSNLDLLLDESISLDRAMTIIADRQLNKATETVIEAVIYSLRSGTRALSRSDVRERLSHVDE
jgi:type II secretory pathway component PulF